ncbi:hypothetical protein F5887DRAFT_1074247 [Amanita rubescens]|nr:hypothetical protein F5887DRAFT_1074247 [Amanita rubescens]
MSVDPSALSFSSASDHESGPSRKRARTEVSPEQRKEARAHRNRIAAQNSRDRRKAQFTYLERRVAELEEENRSLRAGMGLPPPVPLSTTSRLAEEEKDRQQKGWDAVLKALSAQGITAPAPQPPTPISTANTSPEPPSRSTSPAEPASSSSGIPVKSEPSPLPSASFPLSPAPSHMSLDFESSPSPVFSEISSPSIKPGLVAEHDSTRHLARMATNEVSPLALQRVVSPRSTYLSILTPLARKLSLPQQQTSLTAQVDEATMECLFREILATSPSIETHNLPSMDASALQKTTTSSSPAQAEMTILPTDEPVNFSVDGKALGQVDGVEQLEALGSSWVNDVDMRRMLESMLPAASSIMEDSTLPELDLGWDLESFTNNAGMVGINVF